MINGGTAGNIVPEWCRSSPRRARTTSPSSPSSCRRCSTRSRSRRSVADCEVETSSRKSYSGYRFKRDDDVVRLAAAALERCGYEPSYGLLGRRRRRERLQRARPARA